MTTVGSGDPWCCDRGALGSAELLAAWEAVVSDPGVGIALLSDDGRVLALNAPAAVIKFGESARPADLIGRLWTKEFPAPFVTERLEILRRIRATRVPELVRTIWHGRQHFSWIVPIGKAAEGQPQTFLFVLRRAIGEPWATTVVETPVTDSRIADLGELGVLTPRELEVLAFIGQGLTSREIAQQLHRSVKTIERHRESIGAKLRESSRIRLAVLARRAGLTPADAERTRV
jgi:DNA-binding CsgD family transcriptional regulator